MNDKLAWALAAVADQAREVVKLIRHGDPQPSTGPLSEAPRAKQDSRSPDTELQNIESQLTRVGTAIEAYLEKDKA